MTMTGLYGEPLQFLAELFGASTAFATFSPTGSVFLYERILEDSEFVAGDGWAVIGYKDGGHTIQISPTFTVDRSPQVTLVRAVERFTREAKEALVNDVSAVIRDILGLDTMGVITDIRLQNFAIDEETEPPTLGAVFIFSMDI